MLDAPSGCGGRGAPEHASNSQGGLKFAKLPAHTQAETGDAELTKQATARTNRFHFLSIGILLSCLGILSVAPWASASAQDSAYGRRLYLEKANCDYCHG